MDNKSFETEVLTRLSVIETKLDDYNRMKEKTDNAFNQSKENEKEIEELKDKIKWISRTIVGAVITGIIAIVFLLIQMGAGIK